MSVVDIVLIALLVLFGTIGVFRGAQKSALSLCAFLVSFVVAFFLANVVAEGFLGLEAVRKFVMAPEGVSLYVWLRNGIAGSAGTGETFIDVNFYRPVAAVIEQAATGLQAQDAMALYLAFTVFSAIIGVCLFIVVRLLLSIVTMIVKSFIPKKKSAGSRAGGFFIGVLQGAQLALAITVVLSVFCGFTFIDAFNTVETEYDEGVMGKYVNVAAYAIKNTCFLPNADMFKRIVQKSEFQVDPGDREEPDDLSGDRLNIYCGIGNLNYTQDVYAKNETTQLIDSSKLEGKEQYLRDADAFEASGFDVTVKAVMAHNDNIVENFKDNMRNVDDSQLGVYIEVVYGATENAESIKKLWSDVLVKISDYNTQCVELADNRPEDSDEIDRKNSELKTKYDDIVECFDKLKQKYSLLTAFGTPDFGVYPDMYQIVTAER